jgi:CBS domain containing-hemolysin-like protein
VCSAPRSSENLLQQIENSHRHQRLLVTDTEGRQIIGLYSDRNLHAKPHAFVECLYNNVG